jgi:hypothetical protein
VRINCAVIEPFLTDEGAASFHPCRVKRRKVFRKERFDEATDPSGPVKDLRPRFAPLIVSQ